ncbi:MAG: hypothetical protein HF982_09420 [Desulfobacteraceae bacterium]|nr:hypothetical protein [Desulfobacteraceae bacterium]MBC2719786.1 hypothetical protein [Desulfobacteraceae bacterium]
MSPIIGFAKDLKGHPDIESLMKLFRYVWLEGIMKAKLAHKDKLTDWNNLEEWPAGRLFGDKGEYRWQSNPGPDKSIHAVLILDEGNLPENFKKQHDKEPLTIEKDGKDSLMILWGNWINPEDDPESNPAGDPLFYANEIPKVQRYPIKLDKAEFEQAKKDRKTPRIVVRRYRHKKKGEFMRCVGFEMKNDEQKGE